MAHELTQFDGLALNRKESWHGLGTIVIEDMNPAQALEIAGLDWDVELANLEARFADGTTAPVSRSQTIFRKPSRTNPHYIELGTVGPTYQIIQNSQLAEMAYSFGDEVKVETAGSVRSGGRVWFALRGESFDFGGDAVNSYLTLLNCHDGIYAFSVYPTTVRVVCNNTLSASFDQAVQTRKMFKIAHTANAQERIKALAEAVCKFRSMEAVFANNAEILRARKVRNEAEILKFWQRAADFLFPNAQSEKQLERVEAHLKSWQTTLETEMMLMGVETPDAWLMANAVSQKIQHGEPSRKVGGWQARQLESNLLGANIEKTDAVFKMALAF